MGRRLVVHGHVAVFQKDETAEDGETETRGSGPISVNGPRNRPDLRRLARGRAVDGLSVSNPDVASGDAETCCRGQYTIRNGHRSSTALYLKPARRTNET